MTITASPTNWTEGGALTLGGLISSNGVLTVRTNTASGTIVQESGTLLFSDPDRPNNINASAVSANVIDLTKFQVFFSGFLDPISDNMDFIGSTSLRNHLIGGAGSDLLIDGGQHEQLAGSH